MFDWNRIKLYVLLTAGMTFAALLYFFRPGATPIFAPCPFRLVTGLYCPGCGTLRALHSLLHGRFAAAFAYNPLAMIALPFIITAGAVWAWTMVNGRKMPNIFVKPQLVWMLLVIIIAYWILRNVPVYPFTLLAPK